MDIKIEKLEKCLSESKVGTFSIRRNLGKFFPEFFISVRILPTCQIRLDRLPEFLSIPLLYP